MEILAKVKHTSLSCQSIYYATYEQNRKSFPVANTCQHIKYTNCKYKTRKEILAKSNRPAYHSKAKTTVQKVFITLGAESLLRF